MVALSPSQLKAKFGARSSLTQQSIAQLGRVFLRLNQDRTPAYARWLARFMHQPPQKLPQQLLAGRYAYPPELDVAAQVFILQTYYALLIRMLAAQQLARLRQTHEPADLQQHLQSLESGAFFHEAGLVSFNANDGFDWYLNGWDGELAHSLQALWQTLAAFSADTDGYPDALKTLYENLMPRRLRHSLGEYYTPDWLAEQVLDRLGYTGQGRLLDPGCGSGTFLVLALRRLRAQMPPLAALEQIAGIEINPLASLSARTNLLLSLDALPDAPLQLPIHDADTLINPPDLGHFDIIAGNPPWVNWESLPDAQRRATRDAWQHYGLFSSRGMDSILGQGKKDLSMLFTYVSIDRYLRDGGRLGFVITQSALKTSGAGAGFRRWQLPDGSPLRVEQVDDLSQMAPFPGASTRPIVLILQKGQPTQYPVPYTLWHKQGPIRQSAHLAEPIDPQDASSAWLNASPAALRALRKLRGPADYRAHAGAYTGGANAVYWVEVLAEEGPLYRIRNIIKGARIQVPQVEAWVESALVYPLLRGRDLRRWQASPGAAILMVQDPQTRRGYDLALMAAQYPHALAYLAGFEGLLRSRAAYRRYFKANAPYYSMFDVGHYTFAPYKVLWQGMGESRMRAAVVGQQAGKAIISNQAMHPFIALETAREAHYLAACLNAAPFEFAVLGHTQVGGKSFAQPGILNRLRLPRYRADDTLHAHLADLSEAAHQSSDPATIAQIEAQIHQQSGAIWGLDSAELDEILQALALLN